MKFGAIVRVVVVAALTSLVAVGAPQSPTLSTTSLAMLTKAQAKAQRQTHRHSTHQKTPHRTHKHA